MSFSPTLLSSPLDRQVAIDVDQETAKTYELMQFKYDGIWSALIPTTASEVGVVSRNGLTKEVFSLKLPDNTIIVGEFMFGSQWSQHPDRLGKIYCFDCVLHRGEDLRDAPYMTRYGYLKNLVSEIAHPRLIFVHSYATANVDRTITALKRDHSFEGLILRNWSQPYTDSIGRYKLSLEDDYVVMGLTEGEGRNTGRLGALIVGQYEGSTLFETMSVGGGFSDNQRIEIFTNPHRYIGRVCKVSGKARFHSGALRHPNFVSFRDDKSPKECILTKQFTSATEE